MERFVYKFGTQMYFGAGAAAEYLAEAVRPYGSRVLLTYGKGSVKRTGIYDEIVGILKAAGKEVFDFPGIMPNPTYAKVQEGARIARENKVDLIIALGGGSVLDCSKVISAQASIPDDIWELEYDKDTIPDEHIPLGAVVTLPGTGSEMNNEGVITNEDIGQKSSVWGCFPDFVILDPEYTKSVPMRQYLSCCFDSLSHCMETYFGRPYDENILSDELNEACMRSIIANTRLVAADPDDNRARSELAWGSSMAETGIFKLSKATDFQGHMIEHQVSAFTDCNHGLGLAVIHPALYRHIYTGAVWKFARFAQAVMGVSPERKTDEELALAGIDALESFISEIGLPTRFSQMGITDRGVMRKAADTCYIQSGCCKKLERDEIYELLTEVM